MTPVQCRQARELLGWHQQHLSIKANNCLSAIAVFEGGEKHTREPTVYAICTALETDGVEFIAEDGVGPGVRLRKTAQ